MGKHDGLVKRLRRYTENCVADRLDADFASAVQEAAEILEAIDTADVRPVVLCRDCMLRQYCKVTQYLGEDGFCSNAEKREG